MIPRIIHRVWVGGPIPDDYAAAGDEWARLNPTWTVKLWDDAAIARFGLRNRHVYDAAERLATASAARRLRPGIARAFRDGDMLIQAQSDHSIFEAYNEVLDAVRDRDVPQHGDGRSDPRDLKMAEAHGAV